MSRKRRRTPEEFVNMQNEKRNRQLDQLVMQTHLNAKPPEKISDAEFERRVDQLHLSRVSNT